MKKNCPYCGGKIRLDAHDCEHCGKQLRQPSVEQDKPGLTNLKTWEQRTIPSWVVYLSLLLFVIVLVAAIVAGNRKPKQENAPEETRGRTQWAPLAQVE